MENRGLSENMQETKNGAGSVSVCAVLGFLCVVLLYGSAINFVKIVANNA